jgi:16S rRNA (uracil1498-N3)-methyltransferase
MRFYVDLPLAPGDTLDLPADAARHAQVRRVQPGDVLVLFNGQGMDWPARVVHMGKHTVQVRLGGVQAAAAGDDPGPAVAIHRELPWPVTLAIAMPANERMDGLVEKATELGVACIQPLLSERSVLRLVGERADRKREHWQAVAVAACEQSGRAHVPQVAAVQPLLAWLTSLAPAASPVSPRWLLSLATDALPLANMQTNRQAITPANAPANTPANTGLCTSICTLSGPEGGLSPAEEAAARLAGFVPIALGPRVLRADTAPLVVLAWLGTQCAR